MEGNDKVSKKRKIEEQFEGNGEEANFDWKDLPNGPLIEIRQQLSNIEDFFALHLVCTRWNSVLWAPRCKFIVRPHVTPPPHQVPWLMMVEHQVVQIDDASTPPSLRPCSSKAKALRLFFYSLSFQRVHGLVITLPSKLQLDNFNDSCLHSSHGWLLVTSKADGCSTTSLYSPLCTTTHNYAPLPRLDSPLGLCRFALSANPCTNSFSVMIIRYDNKLAFWRARGKDWTILWQRCNGFVDLAFLDVTFYRGEYYALNYIGEIFRLCSLEDVEHTPPISRLKRIGNLLLESDSKYFWRAYFILVNSFEEEEKLLVVVRVGIYPHQPHVYIDRDYLTAAFRVMEIVMSPSPMQEQVAVVEEVNNLGNKSIFVGRNLAYAIEVPPQEGDFKASSCYYGCKPNCIYYTDHRHRNVFTTQYGRGTDIGVYNMADGSMERHFEGLSLNSFSPMLWVEPR